MHTTEERQAIAITGLGLVTPIGADVAAFFDALHTGRGALALDEELGRWVRRDDGGEGRPIQVARVGEFGARAVIDGARLRRVPRLGQFCIVAARQALGMPPGAAEAEAVARYGGDRVGVVLGTGLGSLDQVMEFTAGYLKDGPEGASPAMFPTTVMNTAAALVAMELRLLGTNITVNHRDLSAIEAIAAARDQLLLGRADAIVAGGFEELGPWLAHGYGRVGALARGGAMRPYDRRRDGVGLGEGAVIVLLERLADARRRGARVLGLLAGVGRAGDDRPRLGWRRSGEDPHLDGAVRSVRQALDAAGLPEGPEYIAGGGNGTDLDRLEAEALRRALGPAAERARISSVLGQTGESMMSAGLRLATALYALERQEVPGTLACDKPDPAAALPGLCLRPTAARVRSVLIPTLAQGGGNVAVVVTAV